MIKTRMPPPPLFHLVDKSPVFRGDILYHPDRDRVGWYCVAEFEPEAGGEDVRVRTPNGAVPIVSIDQLQREPPVLARCSKCGQVLPPTYYDQGDTRVAWLQTTRNTRR